MDLSREKPSNKVSRAFPREIPNRAAKMGLEDFDMAAILRELSELSRGGGPVKSDLPAELDADGSFNTNNDEWIEDDDDAYTDEDRAEDMEDEPLQGMSTQMPQGDPMAYIEQMLAGAGGGMPPQAMQQQAMPPQAGGVDPVMQMIMQMMSGTGGAPPMKGKKKKPSKKKKKSSDSNMNITGKKE